MDIEKNQSVRRRKKHAFIQVFFRTTVAFFIFLQAKVKADIVLFFKHARLFFGLVLVVVGFFSFASGKYCDGNSSNFYACTRPSTYYYYPWWAIIFITFGSILIVLWFLRRKSNF